MFCFLLCFCFHPFFRKNLEDALGKMQALVDKAVKSLAPIEGDPVKEKRIKKKMKKANEKRLDAKKKHASKKKDRRMKDW